MAQQQEDNKVTKAAFLASMNKKKAAVSAGAKTERQTGYADDAAILMKLGIGDKDRRTFPATVSKIVMSFAKNDTNRPAFRFSYILVSDDKKVNGTVVSNYYIIEEAVSNGEVWRTEEEAAAKVFGEFQGIGEDTSTWKDPVSDGYDAAEYHTKHKTPVTITINGYINSKNELKMGVTVNPASERQTDNSDLDDSTSSSESGGDQDDFNPQEWVGIWIEFEHETVEGTVRMKITSADDTYFYGVDENGEEWSGDYAIPHTHPFEQSENQEAF